MTDKNSKVASLKRGLRMRLKMKERIHSIHLIHVEDPSSVDQRLNKLQKLLEFS